MSLHIHTNRNTHAHTRSSNALRSETYSVEEVRLPWSPVSAFVLSRARLTIMSSNLFAPICGGAGRYIIAVFILRTSL